MLDKCLFIQGALSLTRSKGMYKVDLPGFKWPVADFPILKYPLADHVEENEKEEARCLDMVFRNCLEYLCVCAHSCVFICIISLLSNFIKYIEYIASLADPFHSKLWLISFLLLFVSIFSLGFYFRLSLEKILDLRSCPGLSSAGVSLWEQHTRKCKAES